MSKDAYGRENKVSLALKDDEQMPFGQYKGRKMLDVPDSYLLWLEEQDWLKEKYPAVWGYIYNSKRALDMEYLDDPNGYPEKF